MGLTEKGYENIDALLRTVLDAIRNCPCEKGCPSCIHSPYCGKRNEGLDKAASIEILTKILGDGHGSAPNGKAKAAKAGKK